MPIEVRRCLSSEDRDAAMKIRFVVFVDEQGVPPELEPDEYDDQAIHLIAFDTEGQRAIGTARIVDKGAGTAKIGRVAVLEPQRGAGAGRAIMAAAMDAAREAGFTAVMLDAQLQVIPFYERLGFVAEGPIFDDAGIDHRRMTRAL